MSLRLLPEFVIPTAVYAVLVAMLAIDCTRPAGLFFMFVIFPSVTIIWLGVAIWRFARRVLRDWRTHNQRPRPLPPARLLIEQHQRWLRRYGAVIGGERN